MSGYLLDTHTLIWFINGDVELSAKAKKAIEDSNGQNYVSIANIWEISIKVSLDKLKLKAPFAEIYNQIVNNGFELLPITFEDTFTVSSLPFNHRDPFDRLIIAQAMNNRLTVLSRDQHFSLYNVPVLW